MSEKVKFPLHAAVDKELFEATAKQDITGEEEFT